MSHLRRPVIALFLVLPFLGAADPALAAGSRLTPTPPVPLLPGPSPAPPARPVPVSTTRATSPPALPRTGIDLPLELMLAAGLVAAGAGTRRALRRRGAIHLTPVAPTSGDG